MDEKNLTDPDDDLVVDARAKGIGWPLAFACEERAIEAAVLGGTLERLDVRGENIPWLDDSTLGSLEAKLEGLTGGVRVDFEAPNHFTTRFHVTPTTTGARVDELFAIGQLAENPNVTQDGICVPPDPGNDLSFVVTVPVTDVAEVAFSTLAEPVVPGTPAYLRYKDRCDEWTSAFACEEKTINAWVLHAPISEPFDEHRFGANVTAGQWTALFRRSDDFVRSYAIGVLCDASGAVSPVLAARASKGL